MRNANYALLVASLGLSLISCGSPPSKGTGFRPGPGGGDGDGDWSPDGDGDGDKPDDGDGDGEGSEQQGDGDCDEQVLKNARVIPQMLIVLDRSGSMEMGGRWVPSVSALKASTMALDSAIDFGLLAFPGAGMMTMPPPMMKDCSMLTDIFERLACEAENGLGGGWGNATECTVGSLAVPIAPKNSAAIGAALDSMSPRGGTPTALSLQEAKKVLGAVEMGLDDVVSVPKFVLLVTDGEPNCGGDLGDTVNQIKDLAKAGVKTYVIGYDTQEGNLKRSMDMMAAAGDTGATMHISVENEASLRMALDEIAGRAASCTVGLDAKVTTPENVLVTFDGADLFLNQADGNGFTVSQDGLTVELVGQACEMLRQSDEHEVRVKVLCEPPIQ